LSVTGSLLRGSSEQLAAVAAGAVGASAAAASTVTAAAAGVRGLVVPGMRLLLSLNS
jgi:hypothetical protein